MAKKEKNLSFLQYAALELRYGIEYLIFEFLTILDKDFTLEKYQKITELLRNLKEEFGRHPYQKLVNFARIQQEFSNKPLPIVFFDLTYLQEIHSKASNLLHFMGIDFATFLSERSTILEIREFELIINPFIEKMQSSEAIGIPDPYFAQPIITKLWEDYNSDKVEIEEVRRVISLLSFIKKRNPKDPILIQSQQLHPRSALTNATRRA